MGARKGDHGKVEIGGVEFYRFQVEWLENVKVRERGERSSRAEEHLCATASVRVVALRTLSAAFGVDEIIMLLCVCDVALLVV